MPTTASTTVLRRLLRREAPEETSHRTPDLGLHQLTNDRDDALLSRHPPPPSYGASPYPGLHRFANAICESTSLLTNLDPVVASLRLKAPLCGYSGKKG